MIQRSLSGCYRIPLLWGWAIGWQTFRCQCFRIDRYHTGGWSVVLFWYFHFGRMNRENWTHS